MTELNLNTSALNKILNEINNHTGINFLEYSYGFIKRRTELFMIKNQIANESEFLYRVNKTAGFSEIFKDEVFLPPTELFRDPDIFNYLNNNIIPSLKVENEIKISLPYTTGSEELYSLLYTLSKNEKQYNISIYVSVVSEKLKPILEKGEFNEKQYNASLKNIELLKFASNPEDIFRRKEKTFTVKHNFSGNIIYDFHNLFHHNYIDEFDIVICRNCLIYFGKALQNKVVKTFSKSLKKGRWIILGEKENCEVIDNNYKQVVKSLSIYKRKSYI
jgi:chemotaxis methyl-accepting protein methylase